MNICYAPRSDGFEVWFEQEGKLAHSDEWDIKIRRQIKDCLLIVPIISASTQAHFEGFMRIEWEPAVEHT